MAKIKLSELCDALEGQNDDSINVFNKKTGEIHMIWDGMVDGELLAELEESMDYIEMPTKIDIHDYDIMRSFTYVQKEDILEENQDEPWEPDYESASNYWIEKDKTAKKIKKQELMRVMEQFIKNHNTCALATGTDNFVRCTPIEYNYMSGMIYMFSEGA
jgi:hypothetical protein